jgi:hypothetical protein
MSWQKYLPKTSPTAASSATRKGAEENLTRSEASRCPDLA